MKEDSLKIVQKDIDEALEMVESMEKNLSQQSFSKETVKEKFVFLSQKLQELESILKSEGIL
ncbi:hypothetical protein SAMN05428976_11610 [Clostridium sp. USBA 49]|jgi:hypothetical protein|uniref:hypothetical protein n=1 Tax=Clostridium TaxID=1485 RepID=UPI00099A5C73|nr:MULTISPECIES: hypothetical protein [Clostridium]SKA91094.1 hypothetical protein SAMN05428976_11610 [Clostridium sp. USBA 49]